MVPPSASTAERSKPSPEHRRLALAFVGGHRSPIASHTKTPADKPARTLARIRKFSRLNGWSVVWIAGFGTLIALALGDLTGIAVGLLVVAAGGMEVHGNRLLGRRHVDGMRWLVRSQLFLLSVVLIYAITRLTSYDGELAMANLTPDMRAVLTELGISPADLLPMVRLVASLVYGTVALVTLVYQGGLALYYRSRTPLVTEALMAAPFAATAASTGLDQRFYDTVATEMAANRLQPGLWARALAESDGNESRCKAIYIRLRVAELQRSSPPAHS